MPDRKTVEKNKIEYPPGSKKAIENGCTCNPEQNNHGNGYNDNKFVWLVNSNCLLHWTIFDFKLKKKRNESI
jgi:hypothetical protein